MPQPNDIGNLNDMLRATLHGADPAKARAAYEMGEAAAYGWENLPFPDDSVIETVIDGLPVRVLLVEPTAANKSWTCPGCLHAFAAPDINDCPFCNDD